MLSRIKERVSEVDNSQYDRQDLINIAFFKGKQWISWDSGRNTIFEPPKEENITRFVSNRILKIVRTEKAKILKNRVLMNVVPASTDEDDIEAAQMGDKLAEWLEYTKDLQELDEQLINWGLTTRIAFMHPFWNPSLGEIADETGLKTGDVDLDVISAFEMKFDPAATSWKDVGWACKVRTRTIEYINSVYGVEVKAEDNISQSNIYDSRMSFAPLTGALKHDRLPNVARVYDYWEKSTKEYPNGRHVIYTADNVLFYDEDIGFGEDDNTERILPFFPYVHISLPGSITGTNMVEQLIPLQREYNRCRSQIIDNKDAMAYPMWFYRPNSIDVEDLNGGPGAAVEVRDGAEFPFRNQAATISSDTYQNLEQLKEEFYFVSGQQEVSHGGAPADASGYAISLLLEQDDTTLAPSMESFLRCKQNYVGYALKIMRFRCIAPRLMRIVGRDNVEMVSFQGSMLSSTDIRVQRGSVIQTSKSAKQAQIMSLINAGVLNPQEDKAKIMQWLEFGSIDDIYNEAEQDTKQAKEEQLRWEQGNIEQDPQQGVRDFYNHDVHLGEHNKFRKSKRYTGLDEGLVQLIDAHCDMHTQFIQQAQQAAMPQEEMPPEPKGDPPPPESAGTPPNLNTMAQSIAEGEPVGNSMQGLQ